MANRGDELGLHSHLQGPCTLGSQQVWGLLYVWQVPRLDVLCQTRQHCLLGPHVRFPGLCTSTTGLNLGRGTLEHTQGTLEHTLKAVGEDQPGPRLALVDTEL